MAKLSASVRFSVVSEPDPAQAVVQLNRSLSAGDFDGRFITLVLTILDPHRHRVTVVNAGHIPPLIRRQNGRIDELGQSAAGLPLLIEPDFSYKQHVDQIEPDECLVLYTDGVTEAMDQRDELYGISRLRGQLSSSNPQRLGQSIVESVQRFIADRPAKDDMCLVCCGRQSIPPA
jgi:serine phosphatase RsbU (regulator of sigma subunit)